MLKTCIKMGLQPKFTNNGVMMTVDMGIDSVHSLEDLLDHG